MSLHLIYKPVHYRVLYHRWSKFLAAILIIQIIPIIIYILFKSQNEFVNIMNNVPHPKYNETEELKIEAQKKCFESAQSLDRIELLPDILEHDVKPKPDNSIFFIVTTCQSNGSVILNSR